jgi:hypothetical protein
MGTRDPRVDAYIAKAAPFARPILTHLRDVIHEFCPDVLETMKWNSPAFEYKGPLCGFAAFKAHCAFGFWKHALVVGDNERSAEAMGSFGRITSLADLPSTAALGRYLRRAARLNDEGVKAPREKSRPREPIPMHPDFLRALASNRRAAATFEGFSPSHMPDVRCRDKKNHSEGRGVFCRGTEKPRKNHGRTKGKPRENQGKTTPTGVAFFVAARKIRKIRKIRKSRKSRRTQSGRGEGTPGIASTRSGGRWR